MDARALARIAGLIGLFAILGPIHILTKAVFGRSPWPPRFSARICVSSRAWTERALPFGRRTRAGSAWSGTSITGTGGATRCAFVSKDQLGHGFVHWLADQNGTVYVKRTHRKGAKDQAIAIAKALEGDKPVALFPEGTTGPGTHLLPFHSTLLEAANFAARDVAIRPVVIDYGEAMAEVGWWDEPGKDNVLRLLGRRGTLPVTVRILQPLDRTGGRKQLAHQAREAIAETLGLTSHPRSPIGGDK